MSQKHILTPKAISATTSPRSIPRSNAGGLYTYVCSKNRVQHPCNAKNTAKSDYGIAGYDHGIPQYDIMQKV
jgi:hypothetical protein